MTDIYDAREGSAGDEAIDGLLPLRPAVLQILLALAAGHSHGYAIMRHAEENGGRAVRLGPGTLYGSLQRMLDRGLIAEDEAAGGDGDPRRRPYALTVLGRRVLEAELQRLEQLVRTARGSNVANGGAGAAPLGRLGRRRREPAR